MTWLTDASIRSGLLVLLGLLLTSALRRRSAALRHSVLVMSLCAAAAVPLLGPMLPSWTPVASTPVDGALAMAPHVGVTAGGGARAQPGSPSLPLLLTLWALGLAFFGTFLMTGLVRIVRITWRADRVTGGEWSRIARQLSTECGLRQSPMLFQTDTRDLLATWGWRWHCVLLPEGAGAWSEARIRAVLYHEIAHIRRRDWLLQMGAELLRIFYWVNPLLWVACSRLRRESEQACDDLVIGAGLPARQYAEHLLTIARCCRRPRAIWSPAAPMSCPSTLERRIVAMLDPHIRRTAPSRFAIASTAIAMFAIALPIAAVRAPQDGPLPLTGAVYDPSGAVMPDVALTLESADHGTSTAKTGASGEFEFPTIAPGRYVLRASVPGFRQLRQQIDLRTARDWERAITLQVGEVTETIVVTERRSPGAAPQAAGPALKVGGNIRPPRKVRDVHPVYPATMREAGREGVVPIEAIIGRDGAVHAVRVLSAQVHPDLAIAAADAVRQWRFEPTLLNGAPVEVLMNVSVEFRISD